MRAADVTGFQPCALPILARGREEAALQFLDLVKLHHKVKKLERGFFTAASYKEYKTKSEALLKQGVISARDLAKARIERYIIGPIFNFDFFYSPIEAQAEKLELLGIDWRFETSLGGHGRLPGAQQISLDQARRSSRYVVFRHKTAQPRQSRLREHFRNRAR